VGEISEISEKPIVCFSLGFSSLFLKREREEEERV
jgi:hypothetical protein